MYYIYIIYSESSRLFYVGYSDDPHRRLNEHNTKPFNTFTAKHRPWQIKAVFVCSEKKAEAIRIERFIKRQKSKELLEVLCNFSFVPTGVLARLVRVPDVRD